MLIRIILRVIPLAGAALFALAVHWADTPLKRARAAAETRQLAWSAGQVRCADPWGILAPYACPKRPETRKPPPPH
ncbi:hypothetical protein SAMN05421641_10993 [Paracoccus thiocyanatus]|uniref:Uncharacterized protein n=1 Tax=Paracoccus thiocyanatus TaxID=34006 RepID=A0A1N6TNZ0_9RHOB|nr:hypothetical protein [Paracoccus thiocyanatus]SIQ54964.1 hypothetical protein SAMN05421641_10993 [Paracoccus thiocyanatus]